MRSFTSCLHLFLADGKQFNAVTNYTGNRPLANSTINCYNGQPWNWKITTRNLRVQLNGREGALINCLLFPHRKMTFTSFDILFSHHYVCNTTCVWKWIRCIRFSIATQVLAWWLRANRTSDRAKRRFQRLQKFIMWNNPRNSQKRISM